MEMWTILREDNSFVHIGHLHTTFCSYLQDYNFLLATGCSIAKDMDTEVDQ